MFGKFMNKKFFHPGSYPNIKMKWIHEQRAAAKEKQELELQATYVKEQENYQSRLLGAKSQNDKMKLDLNFMYDQPPGMKLIKKDGEEDDEEQEVEVRFEWQKNAPRPKYINELGIECQDQPFGIAVRNTRCFKCRAWGHQNTDRECPLFFSDIGAEANGGGKSNSADSLWYSDPLKLIQDMRSQHGITLKKSVIGQEIDPNIVENQTLVETDDEGSDFDAEELQYIESLSSRDKKKLLKRLNKLEKSKRKKAKKERGLSSDSEFDEQRKQENNREDKEKIRKFFESPNSEKTSDRTHKRKHKYSESSSENQDKKYKQYKHTSQRAKDRNDSRRFERDDNSKRNDNTRTQRKEKSRHDKKRSELKSSSTKTRRHENNHDSSSEDEISRQISRCRRNKSSYR